MYLRAQHKNTFWFHQPEETATLCEQIFAKIEQFNDTFLSKPDEEAWENATVVFQIGIATSSREKSLSLRKPFSENVN